MIRIDRVVTRGGDTGQTSLGDGSRLDKDHPRIDAIGAIDEANALIGQIRLHRSDPALAQIQRDLFDLGADLAVPGEAGARLRIGADKTAWLDAELAAHNAALAPLQSFILPAGTPAVVAAHLARTVVRRAERTLVTLTRVEPVNPELLRYLNRLSDYLFVLARALAEREETWRDGAD